MALKVDTEFPGRALAGNADYPQGSFVNISVPGANDGTPVNKRVMNDIYGLLQKLLSVGDITPSGEPDTVQASDYYTALLAALRDATDGLVPSEANAGIVKLTTDAHAKDWENDNWDKEYLSPNKLHVAFSDPTRQAVTSDDGFQEFPGGWIMQTGYVDVDATGVNFVTGTLSFPEPFPNACMSIVGTPNKKWDGTALSSGSTGPLPIVAMVPESASVARYRADSNQAINGGTFRIYWMAWGR